MDISNKDREQIIKEHEELVDQFAELFHEEISGFYAWGVLAQKPNADLALAAVIKRDTDPEYVAYLVIRAMAEAMGNIEAAHTRIKNMEEVQHKPDFPLIS